jgi:hypothetical protein
MASCLLENWLQPLAESLFGVAAKKRVDDLWVAWQPQFLADLRGVLKLRDQGGSKQQVKLTKCPGTHAILAGDYTDVQANPEDMLAQSKVAMTAWTDWQARFQQDVESFKAACRLRHHDLEAALHHDLLEATRVSRAGVQAAESYRKTHCFVGQKDVANDPQAADFFLQFTTWLSMSLA